MNPVHLINILTVATLHAPATTFETAKHGMKKAVAFHKAIKHQNHTYKYFLIAELAGLAALPILYVGSVKHELKHTL